MKLLELHLQRFGPFTDRRLPLADGEQGLHVVLGRNEAGKTSALRGLRALLFGFAQRSGDDFVHERSLLRVGARVRAAGGTELLCYRRKGRKDTLLDDAGEAIAEAPLRALLGGIDAAAFDQLFGIDHAALVNGGQSLLDERGREAEALFGAGIGGVALNQALAALDTEAEQLFLPRGSKPLLNAAIAEYERIEREMRAASLAPTSWNTARRERNTSRQALEEAEAALRAASVRRSMLDRVRRSLPPLRRRADALQRLAELGDVPDLPEDFDKRTRRTLADRSAAGERIARNRKLLAELGEQLGQLPVDEALLAGEAGLTELTERLGSYDKAMLDRPGLAAERDSLRAQAAERLAVLRPGLQPSDLAPLRPALARRRRVTTLAAERQQLDTDGERVGRALAAARQQVAVTEAGLASTPEPPDPRALAEAVATALRAGDPDRALDEALLRLHAQEKQASNELAALGNWQDTAAALLRAPLPGQEAVRQFDERFNALDARVQALGERRAEVETERQGQQVLLETLRRAGEVPAESDLLQARAQREHGWQLVRERWHAGNPSDDAAEGFGDGAGLSATYAASVATTDALADRLRREADRVQQRAAAEVRFESAQRRLVELGDERARLDAEREATGEDWRRLWRESAVTPAPPREMAGWLQRAEALRSRLRECETLRDEVERRRHARALARAPLVAELAALGDVPTTTDEQADAALAPLLARASRRVESLEQAVAERRALSVERARLEGVVAEQADEALALSTRETKWQQQWSGLAAELGMKPDLAPDEALDELQALAEIIALGDNAGELDRRIAGIDGDSAGFEQHARSLLADIAPDLLEQPLTAAVRALAGRHREQVKARTRADAVRQQVESAKADLADAVRVHDTAEATLQELCCVASCEPDALLPVLERHQHRRQQMAELRAEEKELAANGEGLTLEQLQAEAASMTPDGVAGELSQLIEQIEHGLQPRVRELARQLALAEQALHAMRGGDDAAVLAEQAEQQLAHVRHLAERYLRVHVAGRLLRGEMERYRRAYRDPILESASGCFAALTDGAFTSVESSLDADDEPVLIARRAGGEQLMVEGMSTGTRDQLYLALRMATLQARAAAAEPLPFIVDDILIQFDDPRTAATLAALAEFSRHTQVILFTHHGQVADLAHGLAGAGGGVFVHVL